MMLSPLYLSAFFFFIGAFAVPDHFYTLNANGEGATSIGYSAEGIAGLVLPNAQPEVSTIPVYRYVKAVGSTHFYTHNKGEGDYAVSNRGYTLEGNGPYFHLFAKECCDYTPFYRWYNPQGGHYFYTIDSTGEYAPMLGYEYQGILGYIFPPNSTVVGTRKPLYRYFRPT